ncbi:MAG: radical SAM protein [Deltaproteobacteria bacterium]|nr:radical SAM protein [Deltaproteobacteria bacterium]
MSRKKMLIIPVFIPFGGCPHKCVFCDQNGITGVSVMPGENAVVETIEKYLATWKGSGGKEVAFYGGSFTGLPIETQKKFLDCAAGFVRDGRVDGIRVSTRPDYISNEAALFLKENRVTTVELGAQTMSDLVLRLSGRGHSANATIEAVKTLKAAGFKVGVQFMPGLPGDTLESIIETTDAVIALKPDFVRVYPTLVLKGTALHRMYLNNEYSAWGLDEMVEVCRVVFARLAQAGIPVIRTGLQTTEGLLENLAAGPYHPSFRGLVENKVSKTVSP